MELARRISSSLSDVSNQRSKGQTMYVNRKKRSTGWVHAGGSSSTSSPESSFTLLRLGPAARQLRVGVEIAYLPGAPRWLTPSGSTPRSILSARSLTHTDGRRRCRWALMVLVGVPPKPKTRSQKQGDSDDPFADTVEGAAWAAGSRLACWPGSGRARPAMLAGPRPGHAIPVSSGGGGAARRSQSRGTPGARQVCRYVGQGEGPALAPWPTQQPSHALDQGC